MNKNAKNAILSLGFFLFGLTAYGDADMLDYESITKDIKIGTNYPVILEGYGGRAGQFYCGVIVFTADSNVDRMFYTFKAWDTVDGKCNFQSDTKANLVITHQCVASETEPTRKFTKKEIKETSPGNRAIEITSEDSYFYVLSRCHGSVESPSYVARTGYGASNRDPYGNTKVEYMRSESRNFGVLEDPTSNVDVLTIQLNNYWNYVIIKNKRIN